MSYKTKSRVKRCGFFYLSLFIRKKKNMRKLFNLILMMGLLFFVSCTEISQPSEITFGSSSKQMANTLVITKAQLDSICTVDLLPNYDTWMSVNFTDYETNIVYVKRMYIKSYSEDVEVIYILIGDNEPYKITIRTAE